jgi:hypothetical protein
VGRAAKVINVRRKRRTVDRIMRQSVALSEEWYTRIQSDPEFYRALMDPSRTDATQSRLQDETATHRRTGPRETTE